jgi:RHS repeat-associated protein
MQMPGRNASTGDYRYGYQGSEKDGEVKGEGNSYSTQYRQLNPRLGRWLTLDPKAGIQPHQSPYSSMDNNPIANNDILGDIVDYERGRDKVRVFFGRMFSRKVRQDFRTYKGRQQIYTYRRRPNNARLPNAVARLKQIPFVGFNLDYGRPGGGWSPIPWKIVISFFSINVDLRWQRQVSRSDLENTSRPRSVRVRRPVAGTPVELSTQGHPDNWTITDAQGNVVHGPQTAVQANPGTFTPTAQFPGPIIETMAIPQDTYVVPAPPNGPLTVTVASQTPWPRNNRGARRENGSNWEVKWTRWRGFQFRIWLPRIRIL